MLARITADPQLFHFHPRDLAWRAAVEAQLGHLEPAHRYAEEFIKILRTLWRGDPSADQQDYVEWLIDFSYLRLPRDESHLREALQKAGLQGRIIQTTVHDS